MGGQRVQALDPGGHAARALGTGRQRRHARGAGCLVPPGQVVTVGGLVGRAQFRVGSQPLLHLPHDARGFEPSHGRGRPGAGQVVEGGKRGAVGQAGRGLHHVGQAARAAVRDAPQPAWWPAKLPRDHLGVGRHRVLPRFACCTDCHIRSYQGVRLAAADAAARWAV